MQRHAANDLCVRLSCADVSPFVLRVKRRRFWEAACGSACGVIQKAASSNAATSGAVWVAIQPNLSRN
jgi:hypothetical protein